MEYKPIFAALIVLGVFFLITSRLLHRVLAVLVGAGLIVFFHIIDGPIYNLLDWNVVFYLLGMMIITVLLKRTGFSQWAAIQGARWVKAQPVQVLLVLSGLTAITAAFLGPVSALGLFIPVSLLIAVELDVPPGPFLITQSLAAGIGGMGTFLGSPGVLIVSSGLKLSPWEYLVNVGPGLVLSFLVLGIFSIFMFRKRLKTTNERRARILDFRADQSITGKPLLRRVLVVLVLVLVGSFCHGLLGVDISIVSLSGAALLLILTGRQEVEKVLSEVNWSLIVFLAGVFILSAALVQTGLINMLALQLTHFTSGNTPLLVLIVLWGSAVLSAILGAVPLSILALPLLTSLSQSGAVGPLWPALIIGVALGSAAGLIGSPGAQDVLETGGKNGFKIPKREYLKTSIPVALVTLTVISIAFFFFPGVL